MSNLRFPLVVTLRSDDEKIKCKETINHRTDTCTFDSIPPGEYTVSGLFANGRKTIDRRDRFSLPSNCPTYYFKDSGISISTPARAQKPSTATRSKPPTKAIVRLCIELEPFCPLRLKGRQGKGSEATFRF